MRPRWHLASVTVPFAARVRVMQTPEGMRIPIFFAADEKTESPTPKKLKDARKKGQVAKSSDLNAAIILMVIGMLTLISGDQAFEALYRFLYSALRNLNVDVAASDPRSVFLHYGIQFFQITAVLFAAVMVGGVIANLVQSGFLFSPEVLKPNFKRLNPIEGFKNQFSKRSIFNFAKTLMKLVLVAMITYTFIRGRLDTVYRLAKVDLSQIYPYMKSLLTQLLLRIALALLILGVIDLLFQKYDFKRNLRMTKHEVKEEMKQMEGDPQIKSQRKAKARQLAMSRMMADVPKADVVINNPTHISVAVKYEPGVDSAPKVLAMGVDHVAMRIREIAREYDIPMIEDRPLARLLIKKAKVGKTVPVELYQALAKVLAEIYKINRKKNYRR